MQAIAQITSNGAILTWPSPVEVLDGNGNPTGAYADNLQDLIAALPPGTQYSLVSEKEAEAWLAAHRPMEEIQAEFTAAIQARLDAFAQTRGYDNILSAASYVASSNRQFALEGQYCVQARDDTWASGYMILNAVMTGQRPMPSLEEVFAELPVLAWPDEAAA